MAPKKKPLPGSSDAEETGGSADEKVLRRIRGMFDESFEFCKKRADRAVENQEFVSALRDQWPEKDRKRAEKLKMPALSMRDVALVVRAMSGQEIMNRFQPKVMPPADDEATVAWTELCNDYITKARSQSGMEHEESEAFHDTAIGAYGWVRVYKDPYTEQLPGIGCEAVGTHDVVWDRKAKKKNLSDREYAIHMRYLSKSEFKKEFGKDAASLGSSIFAPDFAWSDQKDVSIKPGVYAELNREQRDRKNEILVMEAEWFEVERRVEFEREPGSGVYETAPEAQFAQLMAQAAQAGVVLDWMPVNRRIFHYAIVAGQEVLRQGKRKINDWTLLPMTCFPEKTREGTIYYSQVDNVRPAQEWVNKFMALFLDMMAKSPKGGAWIRKGSAGDIAGAMEKYGMTGALVEIDGDPKERVVPFPTLNWPPLESAIAMVEKLVSRYAGFDPYSLAQVQNLARTSAVAIQSVKQSSTGLLSIPFDSLRAYRKDVALVLLKFMIAFEDEESLAKIVGLKKAALIPPKNQWESMLAANIIIDEAPSSPTQLQEWRAQMMTTDFLGKTMSTPYAPGPETFVSIIGGDLPATIRAKWLSEIQARMAAPPPPPTPEGGEAPPEGQPVQ